MIQNIGEHAARSCCLHRLAGVDVKTVLREAAEVRAMLAEVDNDKGWMVSRDDEMRLLYKHEVSRRVDLGQVAAGCSCCHAALA